MRPAAEEFRKHCSSSPQRVKNLLLVSNLNTQNSVSETLTCLKDVYIPNLRFTHLLKLSLIKK